jgi:uncharacterized membrane protein YhaH (DUF805 family)
MTTPFAAYSLGDALLTVLEIFFLALWFWIFITIVSDLFRDRELSGGWKAVWVFFLIFVPFVSALVYLIARGHGMPPTSKRPRRATSSKRREPPRSMSCTSSRT